VSLTSGLYPTVISRPFALEPELTLRVKRFDSRWGASPYSWGIMEKDGGSFRGKVFRIRELFDFNFRHLVNRGVRPIGQKQREEAFAQVMNYVLQNQEEMKRVIETEVDVSVEKESYILTGKVDLLLGGDGRLELLDFKSQPRPTDDDVRLDAYYRQLCIYAHIMEQRYGKHPDRLLLYWTGESLKENALMVFPYRSDMVGEAAAYFDRVVAQILEKDFAIKNPPERKVCKECDFRTYCYYEGTIKMGKKDLL
jgi:DNA helicase-2/ATP-dependent DNA helicase PcrA